MCWCFHARSNRRELLQNCEINAQMSKWALNAEPRPPKEKPPLLAVGNS